MPSATACAASAGIDARARPPASVVATDATLLGATRDRGGRAAQAVGGELRRVADADDDGRLGAQVAAGRDRDRVAEPALEADLVEERDEPAAERLVERVGTGAEDARRVGAPRRAGCAGFATPTGTASRSAATRSTGLVETVNEMGTVPPGQLGRMGSEVGRVRS